MTDYVVAIAIVVSGLLGYFVGAGTVSAKITRFFKKLPPELRGELKEVYKKA